MDKVACGAGLIGLVPGVGGVVADSLKAGGIAAKLAANGAEIAERVSNVSGVVGAGIGGFGIGFGLPSLLRYEPIAAC